MELEATEPQHGISRESSSSSTSEDMAKRLQALREWAHEEDLSSDDGAVSMAADLESEAVSTAAGVQDGLRELSECQGEVIVGAVGAVAPDEPRLRVLVSFGDASGCAYWILEPLSQWLLVTG